MDKDKLENLKSNLEQIADVLYKGDTMDGMAEISNVLPAIAEVASDMPDEESRQELIDHALKPLLEAMEQGDGTLIADIINYEFFPLLK
ncbi:MAG: hypothetical protein NC311_10465 [Muribaculaceae bacterium]|nr:hypothetical protein [Clostridium sp.]MCM1295953.1 hypothetical protein [Muribaculaceae bacterium]